MRWHNNLAGVTSVGDAGTTPVAHHPGQTNPPNDSNPFQPQHPSPYQQFSQGQDYGYHDPSQATQPLQPGAQYGQCNPWESQQHLPANPPPYTVTAQQPAGPPPAYPGHEGYPPVLTQGSSYVAGEPPQGAERETIQDYKAILEKCIEEKHLGQYYAPNDATIDEIAKYADEKVDRFCRDKGVPKYLGRDIVKLALFDIILFVDDSPSMTTMRIRDLKMILGHVAYAAALFDRTGFDMRFFNQACVTDPDADSVTDKYAHEHDPVKFRKKFEEHELNGITSEDMITQIFENKSYKGNTRIGTQLKNRIIDGIIGTKTQDRPKPYLVITITDGDPFGEDDDTIFHTIGNVVKEHGSRVFFAFAQVGEDEHAQEFLAKIDAHKEYKHSVDCTSNYEQEKKEIMKVKSKYKDLKELAFEFTRPMWTMKLNMGVLDRTYDCTDEKQDPQVIEENLKKMLGYKAPDKSTPLPEQSKRVDVLRPSGYGTQSSHSQNGSNITSAHLSHDPLRDQGHDQQRYGAGDLHPQPQCAVPLLNDPFNTTSTTHWHDNLPPPSPFTSTASQQNAGNSPSLGFPAPQVLSSGYNSSNTTQNYGNGPSTGANLYQPSAHGTSQTQNNDYQQKNLPTSSQQSNGGQVQDPYQSTFSEQGGHHGQQNSANHGHHQPGRFDYENQTPTAVQQNTGQSSQIPQHTGHIQQRNDFNQQNGVHDGRLQSGNPNYGSPSSHSSQPNSAPPAQNLNSTSFISQRSDWSHPISGNPAYTQLGTPGPAIHPPVQGSYGQLNNGPQSHLPNQPWHNQQGSTYGPQNSGFQGYSQPGNSSYGGYPPQPGQHTAYQNAYHQPGNQQPVYMAPQSGGVQISNQSGGFQQGIQYGGGPPNNQIGGYGSQNIQTATGYPATNAAGVSMPQNSQNAGQNPVNNQGGGYGSPNTQNGAGYAAANTAAITVPQNIYNAGQSSANNTSGGYNFPNPQNGGYGFQNHQNGGGNPVNIQNGGYGSQSTFYGSGNQPNGQNGGGPTQYAQNGSGPGYQSQSAAVPYDHQQIQNAASTYGSYPAAANSAAPDWPQQQSAPMVNYQPHDNQQAARREPFDEEKFAQCMASLGMRDGPYAEAMKK